MFKFITLAVLITAARAGYLGAPVAQYAAAPIAAAPLLRAAPYGAAHYGAAHYGVAPYGAASYGAASYGAAPLLRAAPLAAAPVVAAPVADHYDPHPQYSFGYEVQDGLTGDSKNHHETRNGDVVQGSYSLTDPDGTRRTVEYVADWANGFNAVVRKEPLVVAAPAAVAAAPLLHTKAYLG